MMARNQVLFWMCLSLQTQQLFACNAARTREIRSAQAGRCVAREDETGKELRCDLYIAQSYNIRSETKRHKLNQVENNLEFLVIVAQL